MSRCGSCPIYGRTEFGVCCPGDYRAEECADMLQSLYGKMSCEIEQRKATKKADEEPDSLNQIPEVCAHSSITVERATELINALIDHMINDAGGHSREVLEVLANLGFTEEELIQEFLFPEEDVKDCMDESEQEDA